MDAFFPVLLPVRTPALTLPLFLLPPVWTPALTLPLFSLPPVWTLIQTLAQLLILLFLPLSALSLQSCCFESQRVHWLVCSVLIPPPNKIAVVCNFHFFMFLLSFVFYLK